MQRRMIDALAGIPGVRSVGLADQLPLWAGWNRVSVFTDRTTDLRPANAAAGAITYKVSPDYFRAAGTALLDDERRFIDLARSPLFLAEEHVVIEEGSR